MQFLNTIIWIYISTILFVIILMIYIRIQNKKLLETVTKLDRGTRTERYLVLKLLKNGIPAQTIFHDLYLKKYNGEYSQIDLVVVTSVGIIVIEVKDLSGWIFGNGNYSQWTQVLAYGREKYRFYNPIMQNNTHIQVLKKQIKQFENIPFYSIVVFYGNCVLKELNNIPDEIFLTRAKGVIEVINSIKNRNGSAHYTNKREVVDFFKTAVQNGENEETQLKHIQNIKKMLGKERMFE
jgi:hypothetical protein